MRFRCCKIRIVCRLLFGILRFLRIVCSFCISVCWVVLAILFCSFGCSFMRCLYGCTFIQGVSCWMVLVRGLLSHGYHTDCVSMVWGVGVLYCVSDGAVLIIRLRSVENITYNVPCIHGVNNNLYSDCNDRRDTYNYQ